MPITGGGASSLDGLTDVVISAATAGDVLNFDGTSWINTASPHVGLDYATRPTGFASGDISSYGRLWIGKNSFEANAFISNQIFTLRSEFVPTLGGNVELTRESFRQTNVSVVASGIYALKQIVLTGATSTLTSGSFDIIAIDVQTTPEVPSGVTCNLTGFRFFPTVNGAGTASCTGATCSAVAPAAGIGTTIIGCQGQASGLSATVTSLIAFRAGPVSGFGTTGAVTQATAYDVNGVFANNAVVTTWSGLRISTGITAAIANKWSLDLTNTSTNMGSRIAHPIALGWNPATVATITARAMLAAGGTAANTGPLRFQTGGPLTAPAAGVMEFAAERFYLTPTSVERQVIPGVLYTSNASAQVTNTIAETTLVGAGVGDTTLNANFFVTAKTIRIRASGWIDTAAGAGTLQIRVRLGGIAGTVILDTGAWLIANNLAARYWNVDAIITCRATGVGGTVIGQSAFQYMVVAQGNPVWTEMVNIAPIGLDTTVAQQVVLSVQWGTADVANIIECTNFILEVLN